MVRKLFIKLFMAIFMIDLIYLWSFQDSHLPQSIVSLVDAQIEKSMADGNGQILAGWLLMYLGVLSICLRKLWLNTRSAIYWVLATLVIGYAPDFITNDFSAFSGVGINLQLISEMLFGIVVGAYLVERFEIKQPS